MDPLDRLPSPVVRPPHLAVLLEGLRAGVDFRFIRPGNIRFNFRPRRCLALAMISPIRIAPG
jgi:hypothetical protein